MTTAERMEVLGTSRELCGSARALRLALEELLTASGALRRESIRLRTESRLLRGRPV